MDEDWLVVDRDGQVSEEVEDLPPPSSSPVARRAACPDEADAAPSKSSFSYASVLRAGSGAPVAPSKGSATTSAAPASYRVRSAVREEQRRSTASNRPRRERRADARWEDARFAYE
jgi:hypothetical protein